MRTDFDNGLGTTQQTHPDDPFRHINRWKNNMLSGWEELAETDLNSAVSNFTNGGADPAAYPQQVIFQTIYKYNHGTGARLYTIRKGVVMLNPDQSPDYVNDVIEEYNAIYGASIPKLPQ